MHAASRFTFDGRPKPYLRLGFAPLDEQEIARAVTLLAGALPRRRVPTARERG